MTRRSFKFTVTIFVFIDVFESIKDIISILHFINKPNYMRLLLLEKQE